VVFDHFDAILSTAVERSCALDFSVLGVPTANLSGLDVCFSEQEVWKVIREMPPNKGPGPDGFTGLFTKRRGRSLKPTLCKPSTSFGSWIFEAPSSSTRHA
jgi:hypothetical protein